MSVADLNYVEMMSLNLTDIADRQLIRVSPLFRDEKFYTLGIIPGMTPFGFVGNYEPDVFVQGEL